MLLNFWFDNSFKIVNYIGSDLSLRWPEPIYMRAGYIFNLRFGFNRFLWFLAYLINNNGTLWKCYLFSCRYKNLWDIGIYLKPHFLRKMYVTLKFHDIFFPNFSKQASELSSFTSSSLNAIVTVELAAQNAGQILTLKCYANTFVRVDAQIEEECRQTISYLKGYAYPKLYCKKLGNQKPTANIVSTTKGTTLCWLRGNIKELLFIKLTLYLSLSFGNKS